MFWGDFYIALEKKLMNWKRGEKCKVGEHDGKKTKKIIQYSAKKGNGSQRKVYTQHLNE